MARSASYATRSLTWTMLAMACALSLQLVGTAVMAADSDPLQDFCVADLSPTAPLVNGFPCRPRSNVTVNDFIFTGFRKAGAVVVLATSDLYPGINTQGITQARLDLDIGGVVPLHTHPRATQTLFVLKGSLYTGFVSDDNVLYAAMLQVGDVIVFPRGLLHFQLNVAKEAATAITWFNSQNPGFLTSVKQIFEPNITSAVIEKSFGIDSATVQKLKASYPR